MTKRAFVSDLTTAELNALSAVRHCLWMQREPFRCDIQTLVDLVERAYGRVGEQASETNHGS